MGGYRLLGFLTGVLLAMLFMAGNAYAHGPVAHGFYEPAAVISDGGLIEKSHPGAPAQEALVTVADGVPASSDCSGETDASCCSQHCCIATTVAISPTAPTLAMELPLAGNPPEGPRDLTLSGLLRPPCH